MPQSILNVKIKQSLHSSFQVRPLLRRIFPSDSSSVNISDLVDIAQFLPMAPTFLFKRVDVNDLFEKWPMLQEKGMFTLPVVMHRRIILDLFLLFHYNKLIYTSESFYHH